MVAIVVTANNADDSARTRGYIYDHNKGRERDESQNDKQE